MTPYSFLNNTLIYYSNGSAIGSYTPNNGAGLRPVIALKPGVLYYYSGDRTELNPYKIVEE